jgi:chromosome segregation ATPase
MPFVLSPFAHYYPAPLPFTSLQVPLSNITPKQGAGLNMSELLERNEGLQRQLVQAEADRDTALESKVQAEGRLREAEEAIRKGRDKLEQLEVEYRVLQEEKRGLQVRAG